MRKTLLPLSIVLAFSLIMTACATPATPAPAATQDTGQVATTVAQTVDAIEAQKEAQATTNPEIPTETPAQQPTLASVGTPTLALPTGPTTQPCNQAMLISETIPDYTLLSINVPFTKSWKLQNVGTCTWNTSYKLIFVSGDQMSGPHSINFPAIVIPGQNMTLSLSLTANTAVGTTSGYWGLYDDKNVYWGRVWVTISSGTATTVPTAFTITSVSYDPVVVAPGPICTFIAHVTASAAGTATFHWIYTLLGPPVVAVNGTSKSYSFPSAGTISLSLTAPATTTNAYLYNDSPNNQAFAAVNCP